MSIAYLDPGNIESDLQSGVVARYKVLVGMKTNVAAISYFFFIMLIFDYLFFDNDISC